MAVGTLSPLAYKNQKLRETRRGEGISEKKGK